MENIQTRKLREERRLSRLFMVDTEGKSAARIASGAKIADDVRVDDRVIIGPDVKIESGCIIATEVEIRGRTTIGRNTRISTGALLGFPPQHREHEGKRTKLVIGSSCLIGERATIHRGTSERGITRLGRGVRLGALAHVAHDCLLGDGVRLDTLTQLAGLVEIGNNAHLGNMVGVHQHVRIGSGAVVFDHAKINKDVPPYLKAAGQPAEITGTGNCPSTEARLMITRAYELLCRSGLNIKQARKKIKEELSGPAITELLAFLEKSSRGICR